MDPSASPCWRSQNRKRCLRRLTKNHPLPVDQTTTSEREAATTARTSKRKAHRAQLWNGRRSRCRHITPKGTTKDGKLFDRAFRFTDTWVQSGGKWQCVASQVMKIKGQAILKHRSLFENCHGNAAASVVGRRHMSRGTISEPVIASRGLCVKN